MPDKKYELDKPLKKFYFSFSRSTTTAYIFSNDFTGFLCLEFWRVSATKYYYLIHTRKLALYFLVPLTRTYKVCYLSLRDIGSEFFYVKEVYAFPHIVLYSIIKQLFLFISFQLLQ